MLDYLRLMRPHQWVKNSFVLAPLLFTPAVITSDNIWRVVLGVVVFCVISSSMYVFNDFYDRETDKNHPTKKYRPLAAGRIKGANALIFIGVLAAIGLVSGWLLGKGFFIVLLAYSILNIAYSSWLKHVAIVDVFIIAAGFLMRIEAGGVLVGVSLTMWIMVCSGLLALFLALAKRRDDLVRGMGAEHRPSLQGYNLRFLDTALTVIVSSTFITYVLYTVDDNVISRIGSDNLYLTSPFVLAGLLRYLQIILIEERSGEPTRVIIGDRFIMLTVGSWLVMVMALVHLDWF